MAILTPTSPTAAPATGWRYPDTGGRDHRLDLLRGYALAAMSVNHLGLPSSFFHTASGRSSFLISAAEAFLFISGFTLGWISATRPPGDAESRVWSRTWTLYLATTGVTLGMMLVALHTELALWGGFEAGEFGGPLDALGRVATLHLAVGGVDILVAYVLYLLAAVVALRGLAAGRTRAVVGTIGLLYLASQVASPGTFRFEFASFRAVVPNAPLFLGGLVLGYHRDAVARLWERFAWRRQVDRAVVVVAVGLAVLHVRGWTDWPALGELLTAGNPEEPLWVRESDMPVLPLAVVALYLRAGWLLVDRAWVPLRRTLGWLVLPMGNAALFTFVAHLVAIPLFYNLPGFPLEEEVSRVTATVWVAAYLATILGAVHLRRVVLGWLRTGTPAREWVRVHGPAVAVGVLGLALLAPITPNGQAGQWDDWDEEFDEGEWDDEFEDDFDSEFDEQE
ncbi:MAG: OpgC domain-containing protein [Actinomycetota bacterium]